MFAITKITMCERSNKYVFVNVTILIRRLQQLWGDYILFAGEGTENDTWCGYSGRSCLPCFDSTVGDDDGSSCSVRMVTAALASSLTRLAKYVEAEWPDRKYMRFSVVKSPEPKEQQSHLQVKHFKLAFDFITR